MGERDEKEGEQMEERERLTARLGEGKTPPPRGGGTSDGDDGREESRSRAWGWKGDQNVSGRGSREWEAMEEKAEP